MNDTGSTSANTISDSDQTSIASRRFFWTVSGFHLAILPLSTVLLFFYFQRLWSLEHYQYFPFAILACAFFAYDRLAPGNLCLEWKAIIGASLFQLVAFFCLIISLISYNHYLPSLSCILVMGSLAWVLCDRKSGRSLLPVWILLIPLVRIPMSVEAMFIPKLQLFSSYVAGNMLDWVSIPNLVNGAIIQISESNAAEGVKSFEVEQACSGVQSLHTLVFCALVMIVAARKSFLIGLIFLASAVFWSVVMNCMRIVTCVVAHSWFDLDLYSGVAHEVLGYFTLLIAVGLLWSTLGVIGFFFSPVETSVASKSFFIRLWNWSILGNPDRKLEDLEPQNLSNVGLRKGLLLSMTLLVIIPSGFMFIRSLDQKNWRPVVARKLPIQNEDLQAEYQVAQNKWIQDEEGFNEVVRANNSIYGRYSQEWRYQSTGLGTGVQFSLDYTFLGWHELQLCYMGAGWEIERLDVEEDGWTAVQMFLTNEQGDHAYCIFSMFDEDGIPLKPVSANVSDRFLRFRERIYKKIRTDTTYQFQCFQQSHQPIPSTTIEAVRALHFQTRDEIKNLVQTKLKEIGDKTD